MDIKENLTKLRVPIFKFNYSLDKDMQKHVHYPGFIELSKDHTYIKVTNRKPNHKTAYILEADVFKLQEER